MSFGLDLLAIVAALVAAMLAGSCARRPLYRSSRTHQREDSRLWSLVAVVLLLTAVYQLLAIQTLLDGQIRIALDVVAAHGRAIELSFYTAIAVLAIMLASALYAWVGNSIGRNIPAVFGTLVTVSALPLGLYTRALDAARAAAGIPELTGTSLQVAGIVVGATIVAVAAGVYRYRRVTQSLWRSLWHRRDHDPRKARAGDSSRKSSRLTLVRGR